MVAVVSGSSLGLLNTSFTTLGSPGTLGDAAVGRAREGAFVNAATGNLVLQSTDEYLASHGLDVPIARTYNSQGLLDDDNGDGWQLGLYKKVSALTGRVNRAGSTVTRTEGDGSASVYAYDATLRLYRSTDGAGAYDTLEHRGNSWTWTDGTTGVTETYDDSSGLITQQVDQDGNTTSYRYDGVGNVLRTDTDSGQGITITENHYKAIGDADKQVYTGTTAPGSSGNVQTVYDGAGRISTMINSQAGANPNRRFYTDADGRILLTRYMDAQAHDLFGPGNIERFTVVAGEQFARSATSDIEKSYTDSFGQSDLVSGTEPSAARQATGTRAYVVQDGDTLQRIAQSVYGDSSLWYVIAQANGISSLDAANKNNSQVGQLKPGMTLNLPDAASLGAGSRNSATTLRPYDPSQALGDLSPNLPVPAHGGGCGGIGQIIMVIVAIVVTIYAGPEGLDLLNVSGVSEAATEAAADQFWASTLYGETSAEAAAAAANLAATQANLVATQLASAGVSAGLSSAASQLVGNALGVQQGFSFKQVIASALSAGLGQAAASALPSLGTRAANLAAQAAVRSAINQGVNVSLGLQRTFSWTQAAASMLASPIAQALGTAASGVFGKYGGQFAYGVASQLVTHFIAGGRATAAGALNDSFGYVQGLSLVSELQVASQGQQGAALESAVGNVMGANLAETIGPQPESRYSLANGNSELGLRLDASRGSGLSYAGARATGLDAADPVFASDSARGVYDYLVDAIGNYQRVDDEDPVLLAANGGGIRGVVAPIGSSSRNYRNQMDIASDNATTARMRAAGIDSSSSLLGATAGVASSFGSMAAETARVGSNMIMQIGNVLTGGINNDHPMMQQVHAEQRALGQGILSLVSSPVATTAELMEGVVNRYDSAIAQSTNFDRSYELGRLFNDVGQSAIGGELTIRGAARLGASGLAYIGDSAFTGPVAGGRSSQIGGINLRAYDSDTRARILEGFRSGNQFEAQARAAMDVSKNYDRIYGSGELAGKYAVPDSMSAGIVEFKDVRELSRDLQFRLYEQSQRRIDLVVSPRTEYISRPLIDSVRSSSGSISIFDPRSGLFHPYDFDSGVFLITRPK